MNPNNPAPSCFQLRLKEALGWGGYPLMTPLASGTGRVLLWRDKVLLLAALEGEWAAAVRGRPRLSPYSPGSSAGTRPDALIRSSASASRGFGTTWKRAGCFFGSRGEAGSSRHHKMSRSAR